MNGLLYLKHFLSKETLYQINMNSILYLEFNMIQNRFNVDKHYLKEE